MDVKLENLRFLGIFGILKETIKLTYQWRRIFTHIALAFILPIPLLNFVNNEISNFYFPKLFKPSNNPISLQTIIYYLTFSIISLIFSAIFSLLSTAIVTYTVACIYTALDVSFKHVINVVPNVWKRLLVTFLSVFIVLLSFYFISFSVIFSIRWIVCAINGPNNAFCFRLDGFITLFVFIVGTWYLTTIWQLSSVVSVLEESCGFKAMAKSKALVKGKMRMVTMVTMVLVLLNLPLGRFKFVFHHILFWSTVAGDGIWVVVLAIYFSFFVLIKLVVETLMYLVCKSYHQEVVDKSNLLDNLQGCLQVDYVQLNVEDE